MARKNNDNNPLQIRVRTKSLPKYVTRRIYYTRLMMAIRGERPLPPSWEVELWWRNPGTRHGLTKKWRSDDFESAINESREGFGDIVYESLARQLFKIQQRRRRQ